MKRAVNASLFFIILLMAAGCAAFPRNSLPVVDTLPKLAAPANALQVSYTYKMTINSGGGIEERVAQKGWEKDFVDVLNESGYFTSLQQGDGGAIHIGTDLHIQRDEAQGLVTDILCGLTLGGFPSWSTDEYTLRCIVTTSQGIKKEYSLNDACTIVVGFPMILVMPFRGPGGLDNVRHNLYKTLIMKMNEDGLFIK